MYTLICLFKNVETLMDFVLRFQRVKIFRSSKSSLTLINFFKFSKFLNSSEKILTPINLYLTINCLHVNTYFNLTKDE